MKYNRCISFVLAMVMLIAILPTTIFANESKEDFADITEDNWYYDDVCYVFEKNLMQGTSSITFNPEDFVSRGMVVTTLYRLEGQPSVKSNNTFTDVESGKYYEKAVKWANNKGIVSGYGNGLFGPDDLITREQLAAVFYRYAGYKKYDLTKKSDLVDFADKDAIADYAKDAFAWANAAGLISGTTKTTLSPKETASRAQLAVVLSRFCREVVEKEKARTREDDNSSYTPTPAPDERTFKAVYDTTDNANKITFYYDESDHDADGINIILYDNLPDSATSAESWGYNSIRTSIYAVAFDESVKEYSGLKSTVSMLCEMQDATSITGAENLNVSNVTNMEYMFGGFAYYVTNMNDVPNVSNWDVQNVKTLDGIFTDYAKNSKVLNVVPNVSSWNTENVTNMESVFRGYGASSEVLDTVPAIENWNTKNVTDINFMFSSYGEQSPLLDFILDFSNWNVGKITSMEAVFYRNADNIASWSVRIPTKTGDKVNTPTKWFVGNGTDEGKYIEPLEGRKFSTIEMPKKSDIIALNDGRNYRVLSVDGNYAKVFAMEDTGILIPYWDTNQTATFGSETGTKYAGSTLDNYLEKTWYAGLSSSYPAMYNAIRNTTVTQRFYVWNSGVPSGEYIVSGSSIDAEYPQYYLTGGQTTASIERHAFALGIEDVVDYVGKAFTSENIIEFFFTSENAIDLTSEGYGFWLSSARKKDGGANAFRYYRYGRVGTDDVPGTHLVRPAFVIDLASDGVIFTPG